MTVTKFKRSEKKYMIDDTTKYKLLEKISENIKPDNFKVYEISTIYLDTDDYRLIRDSIDAKNDHLAYKEKLRLRSYGIPKDDDIVFFEAKKKYKGVVYKRRAEMTLKEAFNFIINGKRPYDSQIIKELEYSLNFYNHPKPKVLISYHREAYQGIEDPTLRITFDNNIKYRCDDLKLEDGLAGTALLDKNKYLMEIKCESSMPLWLTHTLSELNIVPTSFSKYGTVYKNLIERK